MTDRDQNAGFVRKPKMLADSTRVLGNSSTQSACLKSRDFTAIAICEARFHCDCDL